MPPKKPAPDEMGANDTEGLHGAAPADPPMRVPKRALVGVRNMTAGTLNVMGVMIEAGQMLGIMPDPPIPEVEEGKTPPPLPDQIGRDQNGSPVATRAEVERLLADWPFWLEPVYEGG